MIIRVFVMVFLFSIPVGLSAQVLPKEGSNAAGRLVGFSFHAEGKKVKYTIEIAKGRHSSADSFEKYRIITITADTNKTITEVPDFGTQYTWRVTNAAKKKNKDKSVFHHFRTNRNRFVDSNYRMTVTHDAEAWQDAYIVADPHGVVYDMKGKPVLCTPDSNGLSAALQSMEFTPDNTFTSILNTGRRSEGIEADFSGAIRWTTPRKDSASNLKNTGDQYHNRFVKLANGHYMTMGKENLICKTIDSNGSRYITYKQPGAKVRPAMRGRTVGNNGMFGILMEFDTSHNIVWSWKLSDYLAASDFVNYSPVDTVHRYEAIDNDFYFDARNNVIYLSIGNISRIVKIAYPGGQVIATYGEVFQKGVPPQGNGVFNHQQSISITSDGNLYALCANSNTGTDTLPSVVVMQEPAAPGGQLTKVWNYTCPGTHANNAALIGGGMAKELPDHNMLVCMGHDYGQLLLVNHDKNILWSAVCEWYFEGLHQWIPETTLTKANIISKEQMEQIVWKSEE